MTWKLNWDSKFDIVLSPNDCPDHNSPISLFLDRFEYFFFFDLEIRWGFQNRYFELRFYECCHSCFNEIITKLQYKHNIRLLRKLGFTVVAFIIIIFFNTKISIHIKLIENNVPLSRNNFFIFSVMFCFVVFLVAKLLYNYLCPSVRPSVRFRGKRDFLGP